MREIGHFEVIEKSFNEYPNTKSNNKACRWLLDSRYLGEFDHVYVGDVDFLILPESPSLLDQHVQHSEFLGLPYSNMIRPYDSDRSYIPIEQQDRLTGLHFFSTREYFRKMDPIISRYKESLLEPRDGSDEKVLYAMATEAFGELPKADLAKLEIGGRWPEEHAIGGVPIWQPTNIIFRPYHGIHFGAFRMKNGSMKESARINNHYYGNAYLSFIDGARSDPVYKTIIGNTSRTIRKLLELVDTYVRANQPEQR